MNKQRIAGSFAMAGCCLMLSACGQWSSAQSVPITIAVTTTTTEPEVISASGQRSGVSTKAAQKKLLSLGFWLLTPNGKYDETTRQAVMAFQKYYQLRPTGSMNDATAFLLDKMEIRPRALATEGTLAEVDKTRQLLFLVEDGITKYVINTSTGDDRPYVEPDMNTPGVFISGSTYGRSSPVEVLMTCFVMPSSTRNNNCRVLSTSAKVPSAASACGRIIILSKRNAVASFMLPVGRSW